MGKATGFKEFTRETPNRFPVDLRLNNFNEFYEDLDTTTAETQGARCMNCAVPFCMSGCPLGNIIPDFNQEELNWFTFFRSAQCFLIYKHLCINNR